MLMIRLSRDCFIFIPGNIYLDMAVLYWNVGRRGMEFVQLYKTRTNSSMKFSGKTVNTFLQSYFIGKFFGVKNSLKNFTRCTWSKSYSLHDDVIKWTHFPRYWQFVRGIHRSPVNSGEFPAQRPVTRSFDVFFDLRLNKRLSKQSWGWWFEMSSRPLWRHFNGTCLWDCHVVTNCGLNKMANNFADDLFKINDWENRFMFWFKSRRGLFPRAQCTIAQHYSR